METLSIGPSAQKIYMNDMQLEVLYTAAKNNIIVGGRGIGKGAVHAAVNLRNMQAMPGSTTAFVASAARRALANTLPSMLEHWERWGYHRDVHWCIGHRPPKHLQWKTPIIMPEYWDNVISFYNGSIGLIVSQDRKGTSNSKSFDFLDIDEAKFIDFEQLKDETFPANRGNIKDFGHCPWHHGLLITSDLPTTKKGSWFLRYEKDYDEDLVALIKSLVVEKWQLLERSKSEKMGSITRQGRAKYAYAMQAIDEKLNILRARCTLFQRYTSLVNMQVLGEEYIRQMKRDLPPLTFQTSILCKPIEFLRDGFYAGLRSAHIYSANDYSFIDGLDYDFSKMKSLDCRADADLDRSAPLCIAFDWNANINWLVVGQPSYAEGKLRTLKSFFVKYDRKLPELLDDFDKYYHYLPTKEVVFYYDATGKGNNYAVNRDDFQTVICKTLRKKGWLVHPYYIGTPMNHQEKHLLIHLGFEGRNYKDWKLLLPLFNRENNEDLLMSIQTAGVYNGKKDKRAEKLAETEDDKLEARTDGSDAWDTLYIGCCKFPYRSHGRTSVAMSFS